MQIEIARRRERSNPTFHCPLCEFTEIVTDQVYTEAPLRLASCPRCDHRWTSAIPVALPVRPREFARAHRTESRAVA